MYVKAAILVFISSQKPYSLLNPNTLPKKKEKRVYVHVACIPAFEWVVNSKSVVLADGRKRLACRFKEASKKRTDRLLIVFDRDKIIHVICKNSIPQAAEIIKLLQKESNSMLIL